MRGTLAPRAGVHGRTAMAFGRKEGCGSRVGDQAGDRPTESEAARAGNSPAAIAAAEARRNTGAAVPETWWAAVEVGVGTAGCGRSAAAAGGGYRRGSAGGGGAAAAAEGWGGTDEEEEQQQSLGAEGSGFASNLP